LFQGNEKGRAIENQGPTLIQDEQALATVALEPL